MLCIAVQAQETGLDLRSHDGARSTEADRRGCGLIGWRRSALQRIFAVWRVAQCGKIPFFLVQMHQARMCATRYIIVNEKEVSRLGTELKKSLAMTRSPTRSHRG